MNQAAQGLLRAITRETDARFWAQTGYKPGKRLNPRDPEDAKMARVWLQMHREILANVEAHIAAHPTSVPATAAPSETRPSPPPPSMQVPADLIFQHEPGYGRSPLDPRPEEDVGDAEVAVPSATAEPEKEKDPGRLTLGRGLVLLGGIAGLGVIGWWVVHEGPRVRREEEKRLRAMGLDPVEVRRAMLRSATRRTA